MFLKIGVWEKLAQALLNGDENIIEKLIVDKLEDIGQDFIRDNLLPRQSGLERRIRRAVESGGQSEFDRLRKQWLSSVTPAPLPGTRQIDRFINAFQRNAHLLSRPEGKYWTWNKSRQEWLNNKWRHDWRTQPRDARGRWIKGRLRHPYISKGARRIRRQRRAVARAAARGILQKL
jgi:hypothetical protein